MNRAFIRDLAQLFALIRGQVAVQMDAAGEQINLVGIAGILRVNFALRDIHPHMFQRPALAPGIHTDRHRGTGPKPRRQKSIRGHAAIGAAIGQGFIGNAVMQGAGLNILKETVRVGLGYAHDTFGCAGGRGGVFQRQIAAGPCGDDLRGVFRIRSAGNQVVGIIQRHEAFGVFGGHENAGGIVDPHNFIPRGVQHQKRGFQVADGINQIGL